MTRTPVSLSVGEAPDIQGYCFQSPGFYERLGYKQQALVQDHPARRANWSLQSACNTMMPNPSLKADAPPAGLTRRPLGAG
jgi:hypothetical protein